MTNRLLLLSNGHGEDAMGALLGRALQECGMEVDAFPLVGEGKAYDAASLPRVGVQATMPSGGFILEGSDAIWHDIQAGLLQLTWRQITALRAIARNYDWAVGVGDVYPLALNALFLRQPFFFLPTAKSDYIRGHYAWEVALMRRTCRRVFPRDALTAQSLQAQGVSAVYLGNIMMDALTISGERFSEPCRPVVGVLPGSREPEAYSNSALLLQVAQRVAALRQIGQTVIDATPLFLLALASGLSQTSLAAAVRAQGWHWQAPVGDDAARGICGRLHHVDELGEVLIIRGRFGDVLANSQVVLGMSGTGNEQAAGMGIPVVTLPGPGPQFTLRFAHDQQRLLGDAVHVVEGGVDEAAQVVMALLADADRRASMGNAGRERMGGPGAVGRISTRILAETQGSVGAKEGRLPNDWQE